MEGDAAINIGRFVVLAEIGVDATGTVYAAYDPQLDRKVALKVLTRPGERRDREVRALAQLRHPNVVAVHEVGSHRGQRFIAMDLVDGVTLREWLRTPRTWRHVLEVLGQAGSALAAAHASAIVHGDFGLDSVMVEHEHARVVGFGTAACERDESDDIRSFCASLNESLLGVRVPSWLRRTIARGLDPGPRWPSMAALLQELTRRRRRPIAVAVSTAALAGTVAGAVVVSASSEPTDRCAPKPTRLDEIWNEAVIADIAAAFAATELSFADDSWRRTRDVLAHYADEWSEQHHDACVATYEHGQQSEAMFDARMQCLDHRLDELASLTEVLARPDATTVARAITASEELGPLDACADVDALARERPDQTATPELFSGLARAQADFRTGHYAEARADACALGADADSEGFADLAAAAYLLCARSQQQTQEPDAAIASAHTAIERAEAASDDRLRAEAELLLVVLHAEHLLLERAFDWVGLARGTLVRLGDPMELRVQLAAHEGFALHVAGRFDEALVLREQVVALREESGDELDPELAAAHLNLSTTLFELGQLSAARDHLAITLDIRVRAFGELHPAVARAHYEMGSVLLHLGELDEATRELQLAIDIGTRALGPSHVTVGRAYVELGNVLANRGDRSGAAASYERGIGILEQALGREHPEVGSALGSYGGLLARMPMPEPLHAIAVLARARAIEAAALGPDHSQLAYVDNHLTVAYLATNQLDAAAAAASSAVRIATTSHGPAHGLVARAWLSSGDVAAARDDLPAAVRAYEAALAAFEGSESRPLERAVARFALAKSLAQSGDLSRAVKLARTAHQEFLADGSQSSNNAREVAAWLAEHK